MSIAMAFGEYKSRPPPVRQTLLRDWLLAQKGLCALCGGVLPYQRRDSQTMPVVDHDHVTDSIRGVVHSQCNMALGAVENQPDWWHVKAREYLKLNRSRDPYSLMGDVNQEQIAPNRVQLALGLGATGVPSNAPLTDDELDTAYRVMLAGLGRIRSPFGDPWELKKSVLLGPLNTALDFAFDRIKREAKVMWIQGEGFRVVGV